MAALAVSRSRPAGEELDDAFLEAPVADRLHVVAVLEDERLATGYQPGEVRRGPGYDVLGANGDEHGAGEARHVFGERTADMMCCPGNSPPTLANRRIKQAEAKRKLRKVMYRSFRD